jgi:hypothetical protein
MDDRNTEAPRGEISAADDLAMDGLLREWVRGGPGGHSDVAFVERVIAGMGRGAVQRAGLSWRWIPAIAASLAALAGGSLWVREAWHRPPMPVIVELAGDVRVDSLPAAVGMRLRADARVEGAPTGARVKWVYSDRSHVLGEGAVKLVVNPARREERLRVDQGTIRAEIQKQGHPFAVTTPHARLTVLGTRFTLTVQDGLKGPEPDTEHPTPNATLPSTRLEVQEGTVRMTRLADGAAVDVLTGHHATVAPGAELVSRPIDSARSRPARTIFLQEFESFRDGEGGPNELVRLKEAGGEVTAIVSKPFTGGTPAWKPDVYIELCGRDASGAGAVLYAIPDDFEIRLRIRSEKPGTWHFSQQPADCRSKEEGFSSDVAPIGAEWQDVVLRAGDLKPYRRPHVHTPDRVPGMGIGGFALYGYGTGRLFMDRFEVVSTSR